MQIIYYALCCLLICVNTIAQSVNSYKNTRYHATEFYRLEEYQKALPLLLKVDSIKPNQGDIIYKIGVCHYNNGHRILAFPYLKKARSLGYKERYEDYYLGRCYHLLHSFDTANIYLEKYKKAIAKKKNPKYDLEITNRYIEMCKVGKELVSKPVEVEIKNLGKEINSIYPDYAPVISADETVMIFTSRRNSTLGGEIDPGDDQHFEDIYISTRENPDSVWSIAQNMGNQINTNSHDASIGLSPDGQELYVYRSSTEKANKISGDIWVSDLRGSEWTPPTKMHSNINSTYWEPSCSVTPDEKTMYFSSNKPGGFGGRDIWVSKKIAGNEWTEPINLGPTINTAQDEDAPFIHPDGKTLFFSSRAHKTMGGFDIFTSVLDDKTKAWSNPENLGYPINTADDDIFFVWSPDGTKAYFSSIREDSYGDKDIYVLKRPGLHNYIIVLKGKILSKESKKPLVATITVTDLATNELAGVFNSNSFNGKFTAIMNPGKNYAITVEAAGHLFYSENLNVPNEKTFKEISKEIWLEPVAQGSMVALNNVFFDAESDKLRPESSQELDKLAKVLQDNKDLFVEIAGHSDSAEVASKDKELSSQRAKSVIDYLSSKGIDKKRFQPTGYGLEFPKNDSKNEENRQKNRRCEMFIAEALKNNKTFDQVVFTKDSSWYYKHKAPKKDSTTIKQIVVNKEIDPSKVSIKEVQEGQMVLFEKNSFTLNDSAKALIDVFIEKIKSKSKFKIILSGHADSKGSDEVNMILSKKRAESVVKYLIEKGIIKAKVSLKAYGEARPIADNETEIGRKQNRRVELKTTE